MKNKLIGLLQFVVGLGLIGYILFRIHRSGQLDQLVNSFALVAHHWPLVLGGVLGFGVCLILCAVRWDLLLKSQGFQMPFGKVLMLYFVGQFFNAFLFGATGGDVIKAYYVATETRHRKTEVVTTIVLDRLIGLVALILLIVAVMALRLPFFLSYPQTRWALAFNLVQVIGVVVGFIAVSRRNLFEHWPFFKRLEQTTSLGGVLARAYAAMQFCLTRPRLLVQTTALSLLNHVAFNVCVFYFCMALDLQLGFVDCVTVFPVINAIAALPITPGGLGTRESASLYILAVFGVAAPQAVTISLFIYSEVLIWSLVGGVVYFFYVYRRGQRVSAMAGDG